MVVIFDTNAYRKFVGGKSSEECLENIGKVIRLQKEKGITSIMATTVSEELINHLYDRNGFNPEGDCTKAVRTMYAHCGDSRQYGLVPLPETQIARDFFGKENTSALETQRSVALVCHGLFANPTETEAKKYEGQIRQIRTYIAGVENEMADFLLQLSDIWRNCKDHEDQKAREVVDATALAFLISVAEKCGIQLAQSQAELQEQFKNAVRVYKEMYAVPLKMRELFVRKFRDPQFQPDRPERINMVWDEQVLHAVHQSINGEPILLVTSDKGMMEAARKSVTSPNTCFSGDVASLEEYLSWLGYVE